MREDTVPHIFLARVRKYGDRVALREKEFGIWQEISWNDYSRHVRHFCLGLMDLGLMPGDHVSIFGENLPEWLYADLATQSARGVAVGVYPTNPSREAQYVIGHSESVFVVCDDQEQVDKVLEVREALPFMRKIIVIDMKGLRRGTDPMIVSFEEVERIGGRIEAADPERYWRTVDQVRPEDVAIMVYTSGTTGPPKGAMLSHDNVAQFLKAQSQTLPQYDTDEIVSYLPLCHVAERMMSVFLPIYSGATVNFAESVDTVTQDMREIFPTFYLAVPRIWEKMMAGIVIKMKDSTWAKATAYRLFMPVGREMALARLSRGPIPFSLRLSHGLGERLLFRHLRKELGLLRARLALSGAAPISPEVLLFFHSLGVPVLEGWGMTEETGIGTANLPGDVKLGTVGKPIRGVEIRIAEDGEILLKCNHVFVGYWKDPEATARTVVDGWLHTGDVGELDPEGRLKITDRKKEIIITSGGKNIAPSEIENRLKCSPYINEAIVIGDAKPYLTALIQIEYDNVAKWAQDRGLAYTTFKSLAQLQEVRELVQQEVHEANRDFSQVETIKKFRLLEKELDHDDNELTATLKLRRKTLYEKLGEIIEEMYRN
ncbi:MAG: AMP-binding protein [Syntrophales bacterium]|nr:AMP-binding protein [Syntrophales bacterium]MDD4338859.1 AMP-binding protein [Syntrophales bacterium]HPB69635.1 AMP-binding protein [Syntrophales bacterium]HQN25397.1 AMP-binding protein [Syntrophales bacterium]HQP28782.1 AMP-binding protein [Syntrophales bacterium]